MNHRYKEHIRDLEQKAKLEDYFRKESRYNIEKREKSREFELVCEGEKVVLYEVYSYRSLAYKIWECVNLETALKKCKESGITPKLVKK